MKKFIYFLLAVIFMFFQYSCEINVSDSDDGDGENQTLIIMSNPYPSNGALEISLTPYLGWDVQSSNTNNLRYEIYLDIINPPASLLAQVNGQTYYISTPLAANTTYYWKIHAIYDDGDAYSDIWRFTTSASGGLPPIPVNPIPINAATGVSLTPKLSWQCNAPNLYFDVYLDVSNPPFSIVASNIYDTNYTVTAPLQENKKYYWKIKAKNYQGESVSSIWSFTTSGTLPANGLVAYYPFSGNANDESVYLNHGINYGAQLSFDRFNSLNKAYGFNGYSSYINVPNSSYLHPTYALTISAWVKVDDLNTTGSILAKGSETSTGLYGLKYQSLTHKVDFQINFLNSVQGLISSATAFSANVWYNIIGIYDGNTMTLYVNGNFENSNSPGGTLGSNSSNMQIGSCPEGNFFYGGIDDIRIYNRALNNTEINQLYHEGGWRK